MGLEDYRDGLVRCARLGSFLMVPSWFTGSAVLRAETPHRGSLISSGLRPLRNISAGLPPDVGECW